MFHSRDKVFYRNDNKMGTLIDLKEPDIFLMKYSVITLMFKFRPIGGCFEGQTRDECISECVVNEFVDKFKKHPERAMTKQVNSTLKFGYNHFKDFNDTNPEPKCRRICNLKTECIKQYFNTYPTFRKLSWLGIETDRFIITLEYPAQPTYMYEINLKMTFEEYLSLMSSIFSLWFGFSILMFTDFCRLLFKKFKFKFNNLFIKFTQIQNNTNLIMANKMFNRKTVLAPK